jgi:hypothetical protein
MIASHVVPASLGEGKDEDAFEVACSELMLCQQIIDG